MRDEWFHYDRLVVLAVDASGASLPPVPIAVEVEELTPPLLSLDSDMASEPAGKVLPIRPGRFRFRFRTLCEDHEAAVIVPAEVVASPADPPRR